MTCLSPQPSTSEADPPESLLPGPPNRLPETALVTKKRILPPSHGKSKATPTPETPQIVLLLETETPQQQQARLPPPLPLFLSNIQRKKTIEKQLRRCQQQLNQSHTGPNQQPHEHHETPPNSNIQPNAKTQNQSTSSTDQTPKLPTTTSSTGQSPELSTTTASTADHTQSTAPPPAETETPEAPENTSDRLAEIAVPQTSRQFNLPVDYDPRVPNPTGKDLLLHTDTTVSPNLDIIHPILNLSSRILITEEQEVLLLGLRFAPTPRKIPDPLEYYENYHKQCERVYNSLTNQRSDTPLPRLVEKHLTVIKTKMSALAELKKTPQQTCHKHWQNLSSRHQKALSSLRHDKSITIKPADKGSCIVVMDTKT